MGNMSVDLFGSLWSRAEANRARLLTQATSSMGRGGRRFRVSISINDLSERPFTTAFLNSKYTDCGVLSLDSIAWGSTTRPPDWGTAEEFGRLS